MFSFSHVDGAVWWLRLPYPSGERSRRVLDVQRRLRDLVAPENRSRAAYSLAVWNHAVGRVTTSLLEMRELIKQTQEPLRARHGQRPVIPPLRARQRYLLRARAERDRDGQPARWRVTLPSGLCLVWLGHASVDMSASHDFLPRCRNDAPTFDVLVHVLAAMQHALLAARLRDVHPATRSDDSFPSARVLRLRFQTTLFERQREEFGGAFGVGPVASADFEYRPLLPRVEGAWQGVAVEDFFGDWLLSSYQPLLHPAQVVYYDARQLYRAAGTYRTYSMYDERHLAFEGPWRDVNYERSVGDDGSVTISRIG